MIYTYPLYYCACSGAEFFGLPSLQLITKHRLTEDDDFTATGFMYNLEAEDQELFPMIDTTSRSTVCALAIGNLVAKNGEGVRQ